MKLKPVPAVAVKHLDAIIAGVAHIDVSIEVNGDSRGIVELPLTRTRRAKLELEDAATVIHRDAVGIVVGDIHVAGGGVNGNALESWPPPPAPPAPP